jgi:aspartyl/asparaginyl-tRNA synthetase
MGPGSDSEPIPFKFGELDTYLVDSSQFGFEPLLLNGLDKVYCYLPSMRGEDSDYRHLNQFFHCEMEIRGELDMLIPIIERYVKVLAEALLRMENMLRKISQAHEKAFQNLENVLEVENFPEISFDEAVEVLEKDNKHQYVNYTEHGNDISSDGEIELMRILQVKTPIWVKYYHRDRVPFYQKPDASGHKVLNADLLFPPIIDGSFGGEIVGCGQRQNNVEELYESIKRQKLDAAPYEWYIDLRRMPNYSATSGFGMGIERFISWAILRQNIRDAVLYPRLKNALTYP